MENSIKRDFKLKALIIILLASLLIVGASFFSNVNAADETEKKEIVAEQAEVIEPKLNQTIKFEGDLHKTYKAGSKVLATYTADKPGSGVIFRIKKDKESVPYRVFVVGRAKSGWIADNKNERQIIESHKYIDITFEKADEGFGGKTNLNIDGNFFDVKIENTAVVTLEDNKLVFNEDGSSTVDFIKKDGEKTKVVVSHINGTITVSGDISTGEFGAALEDAHVDMTILDKVTVEADGKANATLTIGDGIGVAADGEGTATLKVEDKEFATVDAKGHVDAKLTEEGLDVNANGEGGLSVLAQRIRARITNVNANISKERAQVSVKEAAIDVNEKEVVSADGMVGYTYGDEDPDGALEVRVAGREEAIISKEGRIPVISTIKALIGKINKKAEEPDMPEVEEPEMPEVEEPETESEKLMATYIKTSLTEEQKKSIKKSIDDMEPLNEDLKKIIKFWLYDGPKEAGEDFWFEFDGVNTHINSEFLLTDSVNADILNNLTDTQLSFVETAKKMGLEYDTIMSILLEKA